MPLLKRRPEIQLFAPQTIVAGQPFSARVVLRCAEAVPVDMVQVELVGEGVWYTTSQYGRHRNTAGFMRLVARPVPQRTELAEGEHSMLVSFLLPADAPGSHRGRHLSIEWQLRVHVDIPWWPDARASFVTYVQAQARPEEPPPRVYATSAAGPQGRKPYAEVSLGSALVEPGGRLRGRLSLANTASNDYRALQLSLVAEETVPGLMSAWTQHDHRVRWTVPLHAPRDDEPVEFVLELPSDLTPAFRTRSLSLRWFLEVRVDVAWAVDTKLWVPIEVRPGSAARDEPVAMPLAVGSDRLALVWGEAARQTGYNLRGGELAREVDDARLMIRREHRGKKGLWLVAEAAFDDLDLGLRAERGRLRCRDAEQSRILGEHTDAAAEACPVSEADDARIVCTLDDAGTRLEPLVALAERFAALWDAVVRARAELPPPAEMAAALPQFRAAARRLGAELERASMDIRGVRDEVPFSLQTQWDDDGTLARTVLEVRPPVPIDARWHQRWSGEGEPGPMPPGLAPLLGPARALHVDEGSIRLLFAPCRDDPGPHAERIEGLLDVARRLSGQGLGYR